MGGGHFLVMCRTSGNKMTVDALISLQKEFAEMMKERKELAAASGFAAKMKLRECDQELEKKRAELMRSSETDVWFAQQYMEYRNKMEILETAKVNADKALEVAQEEAKKNSWKWQARKTAEEPPMVVKARAAIAEVKKSMELLEETYVITKKVIDGLRAFDTKRDELRAWCDGGSEPEWVRLEDEEEQAELLEACVVLRRNTRQPEPEPEPVEEWHTLSVFDYAQSLMPTPPPPPTEEEPVFTSKGDGHSSLYRRLLKHKKKRAAFKA